MSKQIVFKPQGVITEPNKVGQYAPGALADGENFAIRSFGSVEQTRIWTTTAVTLPGPVVGGIYMLNSGPFFIVLGEFTTPGDWRLSVTYKDSFSGGTVTVNRTLGAPWNTYITNDSRTGMVFMRGRLIITGTVRSFAYDILYDPPGLSGLQVTSTPRNCGMYQPLITDRGFATIDEERGGVLGPNQHYSVSVVTRLVMPDGYELVSPATVPFDFANLSTTDAQANAGYNIRSLQVITGGTLANRYEQYLDVYRTRPQSVGYDNVNNRYVPVANGPSFYLSKSVKRNGLTTLGVIDATLDNGLGESLITSNAVSGASAYPMPPVPAKTCAVFRGHAFYANRIDPATVTVLSPYYWGFAPNGAPGPLYATLIGVREKTGGTAASASPTITGFVSLANNIQFGQDLVVLRSDTLAQVFSGTIVSTTSTTITANANIGYTGSVILNIYDVIEINGVRIRAGLSPQLFAAAISDSALGTELDVTAVGLEPQTSSYQDGIYPNYVPTGGLRIRMRTSASLFMRATNGQQLTPELPLMNLTAYEFKPTVQLNGYGWSENNEPENCPPSNYSFAGSGEIHKLVATRDCLWFFCSDGLFRLSGNGGSVADGYDWVLDPVAPGLVLAGVNCAVPHREYVYAYTNRGLVSISSEGVVRELSDGRINASALAVSARMINGVWTEVANNGTSYEPWMVVDVAEDDVWLTHRNFDGGTVRIWAYNVKTDTFSIRRPTVFGGAMPTAAAYNERVEQVWAVNSGATALYAAEGGQTFEQMDLIFQPIYGAGSVAPHTQKHWQDVQLSFRTPFTFNLSSSSVTLSSAVSAGTRAIPPVTAGGANPTGETSRVGFTIPRAFPAMSNTCALKLSATSNATSTPIALEAISVNYIDFTDQRVNR